MLQKREEDEEEKTVGGKMGKREDDTGKKRVSYREKPRSGRKRRVT